MVQVPRHTVINAYTMGYIAKVAGLTPIHFANCCENNWAMKENKANE